MRNLYANILSLAILSSLPTLWAEECGKAGPKKPCEIIIDRRAPISGKKVTVENETQVTVVLNNKSPFESCKNDVKREELPDTSAIPTLLSLIKDAAGSLLLPLGAPAPTTPEDRIAQQLDTIAKVAQDQYKVAESLREAYDAENEALKTFFRTKYTQATAPAFETQRAALEASAKALTARSLPNTAGGEATYKAVLTEYAAYVRSAGANPAIISILEAKINLARSMLDALAKTVSALEAAKTKMLSILEYLESLKSPDWDAKFPIHPDRDAKVSGSVSCASDISGKPTLDPPIVYTVIFQDTPRLSLTAGVLVSTLSRSSVDIESVADDRASNNAVTAHSEIRLSSAKPQVIPFSYINLRLGQPWRWGSRTMTFNLAPGVGVNPNNGGNAAEFFAGPSLGFGSFFLAFGAHIGHELRIANGYRPLDRPPADLKTVPTETPWKTGFGVSVSYRIPLK